MGKLIARIENVVAVLNLSLKDYKENDYEGILQFMGTNYFREHITTLKALIWAVEAIDESFNIEYSVISNKVELKGI